MEEIRYLVIYLDNSCEVHFASSENSRIIMSPCGSEFVYRTYTMDNTIKNTFKYRTAYPISIFSSLLEVILKCRNRYCNDRPFISPVLLEAEKNYWLSTDHFTAAKWDISKVNLELKNPIEIDYQNFFYVWKSSCKNVEFKLHFNRLIVCVKYPVKVPVSQNDEYEQMTSRIAQAECQKISKHLYKYTWNEQEFSINNIPPIWEELCNKMLELINNLNNKISLDDSGNSKSNEIEVKLPEAMPLSCTSTHLHKFDFIDTLSEPKIIYVNETWYKLFYKNKSIEICCPIVENLNNSDNPLLKEFSTQDYLISDSTTGRYYTCVTLNRRNGEIEESKICVENIPSFKIYLKRSLSYSNILLKRIESIKYLSNYSTCYVNKKYEEMDQSFKINRNQSNLPSVSIQNFTTNKSECSDIEARDNTIKKQFVFEQIGHFKFFKNNSILINFIDKVKLCLDDYSLKMYLCDKPEKCSVFIYLPDNSQHEIYLSEKHKVNAYFGKYIGFVEQWIAWLIESKTIKFEKDAEVQKIVDNTEIISVNTLQAHLNKLKFFNSSIESQEKPEPVFSSTRNITENYSSSNLTSKNDESLISVNNLLKETSQFLKNISNNP